MIDYPAFFRTVTGRSEDPYPYQTAIAGSTWPEIVCVPTGLGKTAAIIVSWLYRRIVLRDETPRRLLYCLPMRVLVEQIAANARTWVGNLRESGLIESSQSIPEVAVLMGGDVDRDWDRFPEKNLILIGTQDQLLSRALNRGYGVSRFRWPIQFGLLNNDCLWVMDEVQLMGSGLATTSQLQGFRQILGGASLTRSLWMSATFSRRWLETFDYKPWVADLREVTLSEADRRTPAVATRLNAAKPIGRADCDASKEQRIAEFALAAHRPGTRTLVVVNTVARAGKIFESLAKKKPQAAIHLLHSRFRPGDRKAILESILLPPGDRGSIVVTTQVIEAGVELSSTTLITDLAPWASLVQRFGRCNRDGLEGNARIFWLEIDYKKRQAALPYTSDELAIARAKLTEIHDARPANMTPVTNDLDITTVLRRRDILDLFDTTPDLSGLDIDVSAFIRETTDHDCTVFWRDIDDSAPKPDEPAPSPEELCPVPVSEIRVRRKAGVRFWRWDHLDKTWQSPDAITPGMVLMLSLKYGGYSEKRGWTGKAQDKPVILPNAPSRPEGYDDDPQSASVWQSLADHTDDVDRMVESLIERIGPLRSDLVDWVRLAARWHDVGKAHPVFQQAVLGIPPQADPSTMWAKTALRNIKYSRRGFRHELASALVMLAQGLPMPAVYLAAAHHGKIRISIRSLPTERPPVDSSKRFARGIFEGDVIPGFSLAPDLIVPATIPDLSCMEIGESPSGPSWVARILAIRDDLNLGPFRLAFLEAILRTADWRASFESITRREP